MRRRQVGPFAQGRSRLPTTCDLSKRLPAARIPSVSITTFAAMPEGRLEAPNEAAFFERLGQIANCAGFEHSRASALFGVGRMNINGSRSPWASKWACNSTPFIPGIWTSAITHEAPFKQLDCKKSSAEANVWTLYPSDLTRLSVVARMDASSSMIAIIGYFDRASVP